MSIYAIDRRDIRPLTTSSCVSSANKSNLDIRLSRDPSIFRVTESSGRGNSIRFQGGKKVNNPVSAAELVNYASDMNFLRRAREHEVPNKGVHVMTPWKSTEVRNNSKKKRVRGAGRKAKQQERFRRATKLP